MGITKSDKREMNRELERVTHHNSQLEGEIMIIRKDIERYVKWLDMVRFFCGIIGSGIIFISLFYDYIAELLLLRYNRGFSWLQFFGVLIGAIILELALYQQKE